MIKVQDLAKSFISKGKPRKTIRAVEGVSFNAADGVITGLLGPNGAGKTTLLRMLATLLTPDSGDAQIDDYDIARNPLDVRRRIGVLSDARGIYPRLTTRENIRYYGALQGLSGDALEKRIDLLIEQLGIGELAERRTEGFSQGERMKVAIARILVHDPHNVLLDEPTNGLDVLATRAMRDMIRGLKSAGKCVLFSSHIMQEVAALCDHIVIIGRGRIVAQGTAQTLLAESKQTSLEEAFVSLLGSAEGLQQ